MQTNLLAEKNDIENIEFKMVRFQADGMEFRNNLKLNEAKINCIEDTLVEISNKIDEKDIKNFSEIE